MAIKLIKKTEKKKEKDIAISLETQVLRLTNELAAQAKDLYETNQRIDRIVDALGKSKNVKGF